MRWRSFLTGLVAIAATPLVAESQPVLVARAPALVFNADDIVSVVIKRKRTCGTSGQEHTATISLRPGETEQLRQLSERNLGRRVDIRLNGERLSTPLIVAPIPSGLITLDVGSSPVRRQSLGRPTPGKVFGAVPRACLQVLPSASHRKRNSTFARYLPRR